MKKILFLLAFNISILGFGQSITKRALFLGNSYTQVNNLPQLVSEMALSTNDNLIFDSNTPGGYTLQQHNSNSTSLSKIAVGNWDYVILQEQSQLPSFPISQVETQVYPYAQSLNTTINNQNPCAETVFYMTWGRQNGDSSNCESYPPLCTYEGMDDLLRERYMTMTINNDAIVSPVGAVWRNLRTNYPSLNLYSSDGSHPSIAGSYAAACSFYVTLFRKNPTFITFNSTLSTTEADIIKQAVKTIVFDNLSFWKIGTYDPNADFTISNITNTEVQFNNISTFANSYLWDFGDLNTSTEINPIHNYSIPGTYTVTLTATKCGTTATSQQIINTTNLSNAVNTISNDIKIFPNPTTSKVTINSSSFINRIELIDIQGRVMDYRLTNSAQVEYDIQNQTTGMYFVKIYNENGVAVEKIFKQ